MRPTGPSARRGRSARALRRLGPWLGLWRALGLWSLLGLLGLAGCKAPPPAPTDPVWRGVALGLFATDPAYDYDALLGELAARGASDVLLVIPWHQTDARSHDLAARPGHAPTLATVERTIAQARRRGLRVGLMPIVRLLHRPGTVWRGQLAPTDRAAWYATYTRLLTALATAGRAHGAAWLVVGSELNSLQADATRWRAIIAGLRPLGLQLAWSANWDAFDQVPFWGALDLVGVTGYFPLKINDLAASWAAPRAALRRLRRYGKPVILTEIGWPARATAAQRPWDDGGPADAEPALQARLWRGFCDAFADAGVVDGLFAWNWFGHGGPRDSGYSLRGKPAAAALQACFSRPWRAPPATPRAPGAQPRQ